MINFSFITKRCFLLPVLVFVVFTTVLVAQSTPPKEAAPAETGQGTNDKSMQDFQTFKGEEYLIYMKGDTTMQYDPRTGESIPVAFDWDNKDMLLYKGNLGGRVLVSERKETINGVPFNFQTYKQVSPNGNVIVYDPVKNIPDVPTVSIPGYPDFILEKDEIVDQDGAPFFLQKYPLAWIDQTTLLFEKGQSREGYFTVDIKTGKETQILEEYSYVEGPGISPSGKYIAGGQAKGKWDPVEYGEGYAFIYSFETGRRTTLADPGGFIGWTTKKLALNPAKSGFLFLACTGGYANHCAYPSPLTFGMPFPCGEAYLVTRDGSYNTPAQCNLLPGGYPLLPGETENDHHDCRPCIDFADQAVGGTGSNPMQVLAAAAGTVKWADWQDANHNLGYGLCVAIAHTDGTFTIYGHLQVGSLLVSYNQYVPKGQPLGIEGSTGESTGQHIHFERRTGTPLGLSTNSYWMQFDELGPGQIPVSGHVYISKNGTCSMPCVNGGTLPACGGFFSSQSTNILNPNTRSTYFVPTSTGGNLATTNLSGPEKIYQITPSITGVMSVKITNSSIHNAIILSDATCSNLNTLLNCKGTAGTSGNNYTASCNVTAGTTYYIVVDGIGGAYGSYNLTVNTPCLPNLTEYGSTMSSAGRNVSITAKVANNGTGNAGPFHARYWLSSDPAFGNDYVLATVNYSNGLPAGYFSTFPFTVTATTNVPAGTYYVLFHYDYLYAVTESNENDNAFYFNNTITLPSAFTSGGVDDRSVEVMGMVEVSADGTVTLLDSSSNEMSSVMPIHQGLTSMNVLTACTATVNGFEISVNNVAENSEYMVTYPSGQVVCSGKSKYGSVTCSVNASGIYVLSIIDGSGNKCSQKIFVK